MDRALTLDFTRRHQGGPVITVRGSWPLDGAPVTVLFGHSGCGKTTVLRVLAGLERPQQGRITFDGEPWFDAARRLHRSPQARRIGLVAQRNALFPHLDVAANIGFSLAGWSRAERAARVQEVAALVRVEALLGRGVEGLSGGEAQRVALARALAPRPRLLLLDEPLSALDAPAREQLRGELRALLLAAAIPAVLVTHDRVEALALGDRLAVLAGGELRQVGPVAEVFAAPRDVEVARVVGTENVLAARLVRREEGLAVVRVGGAELQAVDPGGLDDEAWVCLRAEEVALELGGSGQGGSARNRLSGTVVVRVDEGALTRVTLDCGFRLVALVTRRSAERLALAPGRAVVAVVKAPALLLVARRPARGETPQPTRG